MRSLQIMQLLKDPHANKNNKTRDRLEKKLKEMAAPAALGQPNQTTFLYNNTMTGPDEQVYRVSSNDPNELTLIVPNLISFNNFSAGGDCLDPTVNLFNRSDCLNYMAVTEVWDSILLLDACNTNTTTTINSSALFAALTAFCAAAVTPGDDDSNDEAIFDAVTLTTMLMMGILFGLVAGMCCYSRTDRTPHVSNTWLYDRGRQSEQQSRYTIEELGADGADDADDDEAMSANRDEPDGSDELYGSGQNRDRNLQGYGRLSTGP
jgi:hypothetical protein